MAGEPAERVAVIDVGSNTLLMLIVERRGEAIVRVRDECRFGRLGQGLDDSGSLSPAAIDRSLAILEEYREEALAEGASRVAAIGTQALREANNSSAFLLPAREILGTAVEVIGGEREAELAFAAAVACSEELARGDVVVADVGGASTEIIAGRAGRLLGEVSLPLGCVRHTERHLASDPPTAEEMAALVADIDSVLSNMPLETPRGASLVASGGTASTLAAVALGLSQYDPDRVHGTRLSVTAVEAELQRYLSLTTAKRRALPGMEPERADVIAAGVTIYTRLLGRLGAPEIVISDRGVRWGLALELLRPAR